MVNYLECGFHMEKKKKQKQMGFKIKLVICLDFDEKHNST